MRRSLVYQDYSAITMLLTDRNFNTSFYDPALRHSSAEHPIIILLGAAVYHSNSMIEKAAGLFDGAVSNELLFLGSMISIAILMVLYRYAFRKSIFNSRLAKAKIYFKTGSTYEALIVCFKYSLNWTNQINLSDLRGWDLQRWGGSGSHPATMPEQNQSRIRSLTVMSFTIGDMFYMHSGNLGKYLLKLLGNVLSFVFSKPSLFKSQRQEGISLNGGKIVEKANVFGNSKNMPNSIRLNNANPWSANVQKRGISTDSSFAFYSAKSTAKENRKSLNLTMREL